MGGNRNRMEVKKGKAYTNRKTEDERPEADFYPTPQSLVKVLLGSYNIPRTITIWEPACGEGAISSFLKEEGYSVFSTDLRSTRAEDKVFDFLDRSIPLPEEVKNVDIIITNPPFSRFDDFVIRAKELAPIVIMICKVNFLGAYQRSDRGVWKNLKHFNVFNRQVDYRSPVREDGKFQCGNLITGWAIWDRSWKENYWTQRVLDVQPYVVQRGELFSENS